MKSGGACMECSCGHMGNFTVCPKCGERMGWSNFDESPDDHYEVAEECREDMENDNNEEPD